MHCMSCINFHFLGFYSLNSLSLKELTTTLCNHFQNEGSKSDIIICKIFPFNVLSLLPHTVLHLFLTVKSIQIKCSFLFRIKAGKEQNPPHTDQRGVFPRTERGLLGTSWTDNPWSSYAVLCTNWTDSSFFHRTYKSWLAKNYVVHLFGKAFYTEQKLSQ